MVNMTHHGHHRWPWCHCPLVGLGCLQAGKDILVCDTFDRMTEFINDKLGCIGINALARCRHDTHFHQNADNICTALSHSVG